MSKPILLIFNVMFFSVAIYLTFKYYDWKLFIIILLFLWANNLGKLIGEKK